MELGEPDASGRRRPVPVEGSEFVVECDQVITAIGQYPKLDGTSEEQGVKRTKWRTIEVDDWTFQTDDPRVFAGGDVVLGAQTVIQAVAQGKKAAWSMDAYLRGVDMAEVAQSARRAQGDAVLRRPERQDRPRPAHRAHGRDPAGVHRHDHRRDAPEPAGRDAQARARGAQDQLQADRAGLQRGRGRARRRAAASTATARPTASATCSATASSTRCSRTASTAASAHDYPADFRHDFIMREPNRCINCGRCVRVCRIEVGSSCYDNMGRGFDTIVSHRRQPAAADGRLRLVRQVRRDVPDRLHRDQSAPARQLRPRREPLHLLRRVRRGLPLRRPRADRLLRARRLQPHDDGPRVALRARAAPRRPAARDGHRPGAARARRRARPRLGLGADQGRPGRPRRPGGRS